MTSKRSVSIAANYIYAGSIFHLSYVVIDSCNRIVSVNPLEGEVANTVFVNGVLLLLPQDSVPRLEKMLPGIKQNPPIDYHELLALLQEKLPVKCQGSAEYRLWNLRLVPFTAAELRTDDCGRYSNI